MKNHARASIGATLIALVSASGAFGQGCNIENYCSTNPTSLGVPADMSSNGDCLFSNNNFTLIASPVPNEPGIFFYSAGQSAGGFGFPFGNGRRCVGNATQPIARLPVVFATGNTMMHTLNFGAFPFSAVQITPGTSWNFQAWFRDPNGGSPGFNLSDGLNVTFPATLTLTSDDFNSCDGVDLGTWTEIDPLGDSAFDVIGAGTNDAVLHISVPAGTDHDAFDINSAPRIMQAVEDTDFVIDVKFESAPTSDAQIEGIIVEQNDAFGLFWMRFDFVSNAAGLHAFSAYTLNDVSQIKGDVIIPTASPIWMRVERSGFDWTQSWSDDGTNWTVATTFNQPMDTTAIGVFAGNQGSPAPEFEMYCDYFFDAANPIGSEDGALGGTTAENLTLNATSNGQIDVDPDLTTFFCDETVTVTAVPDPGFLFDQWTGDLSGSTNPSTLDLSADRTIGALFMLDTNPPVITDLVVEPSDTTIKVTWTTDEPATSAVDYGLTTGYGQTVSDGALVLDHCVEISGLSTETIYHLQVRTSDVNLLEATSADQEALTTLTTIIQSDDFNSPILAAFWQEVDPQNDTTMSLTGSGTSDAHLLIQVPGGSDHDAFDLNLAPRLMQAIADPGDFQVEVKFESPMTQEFQVQGLLFEESSLSGLFWLRFDFVRDSAGLRAFAAYTVNDNSFVKIDVPITNGSDLWMRVTRFKGLWTQEYSLDGSNWTESGDFMQPIDLTHVGVFAGNQGTPAPAHTAIVDYFFNTDFPVVPEDV